MRWFFGCLLTFAFTGFCLAQSSTLLFDGVKLTYQRPGETKFREDEGALLTSSKDRRAIRLREGGARRTHL